MLGSCRHQVPPAPPLMPPHLHVAPSLAPHPKPQNLVPLVAVSMEPGRSLCLVYPLMPHGSLDDLLAQPSRRQACGAAQRLRIAMEIATGILYLHTPIPGALSGGGGSGGGGGCW